MSLRRIIQPVNRPIDFAKILGPRNIQLLIELMWVAYGDLINKPPMGFDPLTSFEPVITAEWASKLCIRWKEENYAMKVVPLTEFPDPTLWKGCGKIPAIDFVFKSDYVYNAYFGAECKIIKNIGKNDYSEYINQGVMRFIDGQYSSKSSQSAMVAYVIQKPIDDVIAEIGKRILTINNKQPLQRDWSHLNNPHYNSIHTRILDSVDMKIHHMFFCFG